MERHLYAIYKTTGKGKAVMLRDRIGYVVAEPKHLPAPRKGYCTSIEDHRILSEGWGATMLSLRPVIAPYLKPQPAR